MRNLTKNMTFADLYKNTFVKAFKMSSWQMQNIKNCNGHMRA